MKKYILVAYLVSNLNASDMNAVLYIIPLLFTPSSIGVDRDIDNRDTKFIYGYDIQLPIFKQKIEGECKDTEYRHKPLFKIDFEENKTNFHLGYRYSFKFFNIGSSYSFDKKIWTEFGGRMCAFDSRYACINGSILVGKELEDSKYSYGFRTFWSII